MHGLYLCGGVSQMARAGHSRPKAPLCQVCQTGLIAAASLSVCVCGRADGSLTMTQELTLPLVTQKRKREEEGGADGPQH